jgi:uncharacterized membrane protein YphA (DoxX/SURF4 family)
MARSDRPGADAPKNACWRSGSIFLAHFPQSFFRLGCHIGRVSFVIGTNGDTTMKAKAIGYWVTTALLVIGGLAGGAAQLTHQPANIEALRELGYPAYLATIIGFWKILGAVVLAVPRLPRLKEWAYAGFFFVMTGAAVSHVMGGSAAWHVAPPLVVAALTVASWALRPQSRALGSLFPEDRGSAPEHGAAPMPAR